MVLHIIFTLLVNYQICPQGNKGASAIRLSLGSTVISFVNAHLAAFDEYADKRDADFHDLSRRLLLQTSPVDDEETSAIEVKEENVFRSDVVFWMVGTLSLSIRYIFRN